jgi:hypothetical protein
VRCKNLAIRKNRRDLDRRLAARTISATSVAKR